MVADDIADHHFKWRAQAWATRANEDRSVDPIRATVAWVYS